ncbi:Type II secretion protein EtpG [Georgfuchsia toluolica]|uniref:Type II secretion system protein H n=1 Tax=Georgfuchsia toluolica TaxID=424218 RepID=A0A916J824_9PROT|nr:type II secretion system protein [Georgfuchsia toluolica]CAG4885195.1 Type II secretion protein EtpG [Georgfuchsia toluolica]
MKNRLPRGFTLIELIVTMIIVGILAVTILPKFADRSIFQDRGFQDETRSLLRYAQKSAVAQRHNVCVTLAAGGVTLKIDSAGSCDGTLDLPANPNGGSGLTASVGSFKFQPLGDTDQSADITVTIAGTAIAVDHKTGYVY